MRNTRKKVIKTVYKEEGSDAEESGGDFSDSGSEARISDQSESSEEIEEDSCSSDDFQKDSQKRSKPNLVNKKNPYNLNLDRPPLRRKEKFAKKFISKIAQQNSLSEDEHEESNTLLTIKDLTAADKLLPTVLNLSESESSGDESTTKKRKPTTSLLSSIPQHIQDEQIDQESTANHDIWSKNLGQNSEEIAIKAYEKLHHHSNQMEETKAKLQQYTTKKQKKKRESNVKDLLALGEDHSDNKQDTSFKNDSSESENEDWEVVKDAKIIPKTGIQLVVDFPGAECKKRKPVDVEMMMRRKINRVKKEYQVYMHKVHLLCWLGHGNYVNKEINDQKVMAAALSLVPSQKCYPGSRVDIKYIGQATTWYRDKMTIKQEKNEDKFKAKAPPLKAQLLEQIKSRSASSKKMLVYIFVSMLRALGVQCRLVLNFVTLPLKPPSSELCSLSTKPNKKIGDQSNEKPSSESKTKERPKKTMKSGNGQRGKKMSNLDQLDGPHLDDSVITSLSSDDSLSDNNNEEFIYPINDTVQPQLFHANHHFVNEESEGELSDIFDNLLLEETDSSTGSEEEIYDTDLMDILMTTQTAIFDCLEAARTRYLNNESDIEFNFDNSGTEDSDDSSMVQLDGNDDKVLRVRKSTRNAKVIDKTNKDLETPKNNITVSRISGEGPKSVKEKDNSPLPTKKLKTNTSEAVVANSNDRESLARRKTPQRNKRVGLSTKKKANESITLSDGISQKNLEESNIASPVSSTNGSINSATMRQPRTAKLAAVDALCDKQSLRNTPSPKSLSTRIKSPCSNLINGNAKKEESKREKSKTNQEKDSNKLNKPKSASTTSCSQVESNDYLEPAAENKIENSKSTTTRKRTKNSSSRESNEKVEKNTRSSSSQKKENIPKSGPSTSKNSQNISSIFFKEGSDSETNGPLPRKRSRTASNRTLLHPNGCIDQSKAKARTLSAPGDNKSEYFEKSKPQKEITRISHRDLVAKEAATKKGKNITKDLIKLIKDKVQGSKLKSVKAKKAESDCDSDYKPEDDMMKMKYLEDDDFKPTKISPRTITKKDRRVLSSDEELIKKKNSIDVWCEVFVEEEEQWIAIDVVKGQVHCVNELYSRATHPVCYVVAWDNNNYAKDVTRRYVPHYNTATRRQRVDATWWERTMRPWLGPRSARDKAEDEQLDKMHLEAPLPKVISEYKNHPLYALKRHLLKFEAIYPPDAPPIGFVRGEPVFARECVHVCRSRDIWLKEARVVKLGEKPYKIVKARPKWDRLSNQVISDKMLEIFGPWQTQEYEPPTAENGMVPRNAYGNVELFKECMLPKGTVHIKRTRHGPPMVRQMGYGPGEAMNMSAEINVNTVPGLNKVARKLNIDCAPAMTGFDFHGGWSHPVYDGFVVCQEFEQVVTDAWYQDQEEMERKEREKTDARVYGNWKKLIKGLLIRERLKEKYAFKDLQPEPKKNKGPRYLVKKSK